MWRGKVTKELEALATEYEQQFHGQTVDMYEEYDVNDFSYEEFIVIIKESMKRNVEIPDLLDDLAGEFG